jgi:hypothetical protein
MRLALAILFIYMLAVLLSGVFGLSTWAWFWIILIVDMLSSN